MIFHFSRLPFCPFSSRRAMIKSRKHFILNFQDARSLPMALPGAKRPMNPNSIL